MVIHNYGVVFRSIHKVYSSEIEAIWNSVTWVLSVFHVHIQENLHGKRDFLCKENGLVRL